MGRATERTTLDDVLEIEKRFKEVSGIEGDIATFPLKSNQKTSTKTDKSKSKQFGEVFTPLWVADSMIKRAKKLDLNTTTLDLCAGYGQFTVRLIRRLFNKFPDFNLKTFLIHKHSFCELQLSSCHKLLRTFTVGGTAINLFIGDARALPKLPEVARGIWVYVEKGDVWVPITHTVKSIHRLNEDQFVSKLQGVITALNEGYCAMKTVGLKNNPRLDELAYLNKALNEVNKEVKGHHPTIGTPPSVVDDLLTTAGVVEKDMRKILVMLTAEIVEELVHSKQIDPKNITFGVDEANKARGIFVSRSYGTDVIVWKNNDPKSILEALGRKRYDLCLTNPPYNDHLHLKILLALMSARVSNRFVVVHPANFAIDLKGEFSIFNKFKSAITGYLKSMSFFNGNTVFDIGLFYPCVITDIDLENEHSTVDVSYFGKKFVSENIADITKFGTDWLPTVKPFFKLVSDYCKRHGSVWDHNVKKVDANKFHCQIAVIRGNVVQENNRLFSDDFYSLIMVDQEKNKGLRKSMDNRPGPTFQFDTQVEVDNFIDFLKTDFARFGLALLKISANIAYGEMSLIPWLDFTQRWDDEKLFAHFNVDQETQDYIRAFLPDYYGIRAKLAVAV